MYFIEKVLVISVLFFIRRKWKWKSLIRAQLFVGPWSIHTVHGILQTRILEWFSRGSSQPRDRTQVSRIAGGFFTAGQPGKPKKTRVGSLFLLQWIFLTQESNWGLLPCRQILYQLSYQGSPLYSYMYISALFFGLHSHLGHQTALSRVPCAIKQVLLSSLYSTWYQ